MSSDSPFSFPGHETQIDRQRLCTSCVYFSKNLDNNDYPVLMKRQDDCGLGFLPGDAGCTEMRTDNCSMRKQK